MPPQPSWFPRLGDILKTLHSLDASHLDRMAIQTLFGIRERRARQLMAGLPAIRIGAAAAVERLALIARLESTVEGKPFQWESARRARLADKIELIQRQQTARRVRIAVVRPPALPELPAGVVFRRGELSICFDSPEDLAGKLFALSQAMAKDWEAFARLFASLPRSPHGPDRGSAWPDLV